MASILVVDDDVDIRECIAEVLADEGYSVEQAENGCEAMSKLQLHRPDLVVLDLMMPVMNGWQFLEERRRRPDVAGIPVLVATASRHGDVCADRVLRKPFDILELVRTVHELAPAA